MKFSKNRRQETNVRILKAYDGGENTFQGPFSGVLRFLGDGKRKG